MSNVVWFLLLRRSTPLKRHEVGLDLKQTAAPEHAIFKKLMHADKYHMHFIICPAIYPIHVSGMLSCGSCLIVCLDQGYRGNRIYTN